MTAGKRETSMDKIFINGIVRTLDRAYPVCEAVGIKGGIILRLGRNEEVRSCADERTEIIDLAGKLMLPGFVDTHMHLIDYYRTTRRIDLSTAESFEEMAGRIRERADQEPESEWVFGANFNQDNWENGVLPTRRDLDRVCGSHPVCVQRSCWHISVLNTRAMELTGLLKETRDTSLYMDFYDDGTPNGVIKENSQNKIYENFPVPEPEELKEWLKKAMADAAANGITQVHSEDFQAFSRDRRELVMKAYMELAGEGQMPVRVYQQCLMPTKEQLERFLAQGHRTGETHGYYRLGPFKVVNDGSLGAHTAALRQPYACDPQTRGLPLYREDELKELFEIAHRNGCQIAVHCIGDASAEAVLDAYEYVMTKYPRTDCRHGILHCQIMDEELQDRFRQLNVIAYVQPVFLRYDMFIVDDCVGSELARQSYNWRRFCDLGVHQCGGSDCPVEKFDVLPNICHAVTRSDNHGAPAWYPENGVTVDEAVRMFTTEAAYASFEESVKGTVTVGKYADFTVIDRDIYEIPSEEIKDARVEMTVVGGNVVYRRT